MLASTMGFTVNQVKLVRFRSSSQHSPTQPNPLTKLAVSLKVKEMDWPMREIWSLTHNNNRKRRRGRSTNETTTTTTTRHNTRSRTESYWTVVRKKANQNTEQCRSRKYYHHHRYGCNLVVCSSSVVDCSMIY